MYRGAACAVHARQRAFRLVDTHRSSLCPRPGDRRATPLGQEEGRSTVRRYIIRRLLQAVLLLFVLSIFFFLLIHAIPGGPERVFLAPRQTAEARRVIIHNLGLDQPLYVQYLKWLGGLL